MAFLLLVMASTDNEEGEERGEGEDDVRSLT